jgi:hypothetical protein
VVTTTYYVILAYNFNNAPGSSFGWTIAITWIFLILQYNIAITEPYCVVNMLKGLILFTLNNLKSVFAPWKFYTHGSA